MNNNLDKNKNEVKRILISFDLFKNITDQGLDLIINKSKLVEFSVGRSLSKATLLASNVFIILQGTARLIGNEKNKLTTVVKLGAGSPVCLGPLLRGKECEDVMASSDIKALAIPDEIIIQLYRNESYFQNWCNQNILPGEIISIANDLLKNTNREDLNIRNLFNFLYKNCNIFSNINKINNSESKIIFIGSSNIKNKKIGEQVNINTKIEYQGNFAPRLITLDKKIYEELIESKLINSSEPNNFLTETKNFIPNPVISRSNLIKTNYDIENKKKIIKAQGEVPEAIACLQMIASELEVPFRKDSIEKILIDEKRRGNEISLDLMGGIVSFMGLIANKQKIKSKAGTRLPTPNIIKFKNKVVIAKESDSTGLTLISPVDGKIKIPVTSLDEEFPNNLEYIYFEKHNNTPSKKFNLEWFWPSLKKYRSTLLLVFIASFIVQLFGLANPLLIQVIIDKVISQRSLDTLQILGIALVVVTILGGILGSLRTFLFAETTNRIDTRLGAEVIDHLVRLPLKYFDKRPVGELSSRVAELEKIREFLTGQALTTILDAAFSLIYIIVMVLYSWLLTFVALAVVPIQILITLIGAPLIRRQVREVARQNAKTQSHLVEVLSGVQTIKAQNVETVSRWKWQELYSDFISRTFERTLSSTALGQTSQVLQQLSQLLVLWVGASLVLAGKLTLGQLIAFRIISGYVTQPLLRLSTIWQNIQELRVSFERLADIIDTPEESSESDKANIPLPEIQGKIIFKDVSFNFSQASPLILKKINLEIPQGTFVGIAGQSGSGKSTLMKLLPRLYEINEGKISIDNYDINKVELYSLRRQIGIVQQETLLFAGTVSENISFTNPDSSSDEIIRAAKLADAHEFIMTLPEGYSTNIGERGTGLSGGQKQRIAIARTLINKPRMLIMDEATSALDYETERRVCENLREYYKGNTAFFITHRLNTIKNANLIVMMHEGKIAEMGQHEELISNKGRYYALYKQQEAN